MQRQVSKNMEPEKTTEHENPRARSTNHLINQKTQLQNIDNQLRKSKRGRATLTDHVRNNRQKHKNRCTMAALVLDSGIRCLAEILNDVSREKLCINEWREMRRRKGKGKGKGKMGN